MTGLIGNDCFEQEVKNKFIFESKITEFELGLASLECRPSLEYKTEEFVNGSNLCNNSLVNLDRGCM